MSRSGSSSDLAARGRGCRVARPGYARRRCHLVRDHVRRPAPGVPFRIPPGAREEPGQPFRWWPDLPLAGPALVVLLAAFILWAVFSQAAYSQSEYAFNGYLAIP